MNILMERLFSTLILVGILFPSHDIYPFCFAQVGYDDHRYHRLEWLRDGAKFHEEEFMPKDWRYSMALKQIKNIFEKVS